jgi:hypothetical protein
MMAMFTEPPTVLLHAGAPRVAEAQNVVTANFRFQDGESGVVVPLFIGTDPAERFIRSLGGHGKGMTPLPLEGFDALENLLEGLKTTGVTHVQFNPERPGHGPEPVPIDEVLVSLRNRPKG